MGILGAEDFRPEGRSHSQTGNAPGASVLLCFHTALNPGRSCLKGVLPWVKKLLFTSRLLGVTGI